MLGPQRVELADDHATRPFAWSSPGPGRRRAQHRERMLGPQRVELADDHATDLFAALLLGRGQRREQQIERVLELAPLELGEGLRELAVPFKTKAGREAVGLEAAGHRREHLERLPV